MKDGKLLPCPFCGSEDLNTSHINEIYCKNCGGAMYLRDHGENTRKFTIEDWNNRSLTAHMKWIEKIEGEWEC